MEKYVNIKRICELLGVKETTIYRWMKQKDLPNINTGTVLRFKESEVKEWFEGLGK